MKCAVGDLGLGGLDENGAAVVAGDLDPAVGEGGGSAVGIALFDGEPVEDGRVVIADGKQYMITVVGIGADRVDIPGENSYIGGIVALGESCLGAGEPTIDGDPVGKGKGIVAVGGGGRASRGIGVWQVGSRRHPDLAAAGGGDGVDSCL